ncbi:MAG: FMN-binding protein [Verrucomicrobiae bacterium]|nr:FMN-binding protein [Verrucomicrobiae bacterium]
MRTQSYLAHALVPVTAIVAPVTIVQTAFCREYLSVSQAQSALFPGAQFTQQSIKLGSDQLKEIKQLSGVRQRDKSPQVWRADRGGLAGWFIVDDVIGKHEYITYGAAISPQGKVIGVEVLVYRETHGDEILQESWRRNFKGKDLGDKFALDQDIPNISGATLSCRNVTDGVKRLLALHKVALR